jgi:rubredoxin
MSEAIAEKKKEEIEALEKQETKDLTEIDNDACPVCGTSPAKYPYISFLPPPYGWVECAVCGTIFAPISIRKQKLAAVRHKIQKPAVIVEA